jgi:alkanesulfonate monooxygenase SsuD/methylene tetrahydromethanopterin reductase-like flavin-dependent oxidoreductase (luciferase family)
LRLGRGRAARRCLSVPTGRGCWRSRRPTSTPGTRGSTTSLAIAAPHVDAWNSWFDDFGNRPAGIAPLRERVDAAARAAGRDPAEIERTVAVLVRLPGGHGRAGGIGQPADPPVEGSPSEIAAVLRRFADEGIAHVQLVVDPITLASLDALAPVLEDLDRG